MKTASLLFTVLLLGLLPAYSQKKAASPPSDPPAPPAETLPKPLKLSPSEAVAVAAYKEDMLAVQKWLTAYRDSAREAEAIANRLSIKLEEKVAKVRTKGLPETLAKAFADLKSNLADQAALLKGMPGDDSAAMEWMAKKNEDESFTKTRGDLQDKQAKVEAALIDAGLACDAGLESDLFQSSELAQTKDRWVVILGAYKNFPEAKADAMKVAKATSIPFSLRGMVYDKKGLHLPADSKDEIYAGEYLLRRFNEWSTGDKEMENHISIEISGEYEGFAPGFFIPVAYIAETEEDAAKKAAEFKKHAPGTYVKKTRIFMGCMH